MAVRWPERMAVVLLAWTAWLGATATAGESPYETIRGVVYREVGDESLRADIYRPRGEGPFPAVLCVHGGAWTAGNRNQMGPIAERLATAGYAAVAINYRLAPKHRFPAQIEDCRAALGWMQQNAGRYQIDSDRLGAWGYSAGGQLVALLAVGRPRLGAVVAGGAPCDFRHISADSPRLSYWLGGTRKQVPEVYKAASAAAFVSAEAAPVFFYHGEKDILVPVADPKAMAELLRQSRVCATVYLVPDTGHIMAFFSKEAIAEGIKFLDQHLKSAAPEGAGKAPSSAQP